MQKAIESCNGSQSALHTQLQKIKSELAESIDKKVTAFMETNSEEVKAKCNAIHIANERSIRDIKEKMGEYRTNITRRLDDFINCHKAVRNNINEIRNLKLEIDAQKEEIKNVIEEYKVFNEEEQEKSRSKDENVLNQSAIKLKKNWKNLVQT